LRIKERGEWKKNIYKSNIFILQLYLGWVMVENSFKACTSLVFFFLETF